MNLPITTQTDSLDQKIEAFWHTFSPFPCKVERYAFKYWYFILLAHYILLLTFDLVLDFHRGISLSIILDLTYHLQPSYKHQLSFTASDLTNWLLPSEYVALGLVALLFNHWLTLWKPTIDKLFNKGYVRCLNESLNLKQEYLQFLTHYQAALRSKRRFILIGMLAFIVLGLIAIVVVPRLSSVFMTNDPFYRTISFIRWPIFLIIGTGFFLGYAIAVSVWIALVTGNYLQKLTKQFHLVIQPNHPDKCGGLKFLGNFCLSIAWPELIAMLFLGAYGIGPSRQFGPFALGTDTLFFLVTFLLLIISFLSPLWEIHVEMLEIREENADELAKHISALAKTLRSQIEEADWSQSMVIKGAMDLMQTLLTDNFGYLTWPFNTRILLTFLTPQIITLLSIIIGLDQNGLLATALKAILSLFNH